MSWEEPRFISNDGPITIERNLKPGQVFTWGEYLVVYLAKDKTSSAECTFKVSV